MAKMMNINLKKGLVEYCLGLQQAALNNALTAMDEAQEEANAYGPPKDRYDGFRNQQLRKRDLYGKQLEQANQNILMLNRIDLEKQHDSIDFGCMVVTDNSIFLVAVGLGLVTFEGVEVAVISMLVPIYHAMKGKRIGEQFNFRENAYQVLEIW
jgi:hypothetical protein